MDRYNDALADFNRAIELDQAMRITSPSAPTSIDLWATVRTPGPSRRAQSRFLRT